MKYYYPDNMEAPAMIVLWKWRDFWIVFLGGALSLILATALLSMIPLLPISLYAIMTITFYNGLTIKSYIGLFFRFLIFQQQIYYW
jgi:hypothetical protein